jgi:hypothetical protein
MFKKTTLYAGKAVNLKKGKHHSETQRCHIVLQHMQFKGKSGPACPRYLVN